MKSDNPSQENLSQPSSNVNSEKDKQVATAPIQIIDTANHGGGSNGITNLFLELKLKFHKNTHSMPTGTSAKYIESGKVLISCLLHQVVMDYLLKKQVTKLIYLVTEVHSVTREKLPKISDISFGMFCHQVESTTIDYWSWQL